ncbi:hypothetical protein KEU06_22435 [Pseudaminobacter sp. 19-2017]|uniref:Uncharacterized protein n=1 Tax=Pseudaminobacter soli (ex Zhang et al. 2022) TaxID=2831468 RepID=A0A942I3J4_9HYPH|nr:hypothetical protein [Pseudaminobacter soli]MBS3651377.1 hypothetical protein [Pseudaminobacter soli]
MSRILTLFLLLHWAAVFSLLAGLALFGDEGGLSSGFSFFGAILSGADHLLAGFPALKAAVAFGFAICAVLFWWSLVTALLGSAAVADEVLRLAFAGACCLMTVMLIIGSLKAPSGVFGAMAAHFAALIASFAAIGTGQKLGERRSAKAARVRGHDASQTARLYRFVASFDGGRSAER